ncbi:MAG: threonine--tRNA ligase, partial [Candidatus Staskawiczbacteria bacterium]|nr:threonine--tRNA ligase [Candidatus Staskawiczbacteria bacterium]
KGEAAFYGPKIDFIATDSIGREWQVGTIQLDFVQPKKFKLYYASDKGEEPVVIIHTAIMGSIERFLSILIEHYSGAFPVWLSPVQVCVVPISEKHLEYANKIKKDLENKNIRAELKNENETLGKKIREAEIQRIPYLLIIGDKEIQAQSVSVRQRDKGDVGIINLEKFIEKITEEITKKI